MTTDAAPNWLSPAPPAALAAVITAAERASRSDQQGSIVAIDDAPVDSRWLAITGIRTLASVMDGPDLSERFTLLRGEVMRLAAESNADAAVVVLNAEVVTMAEAWLSKDFGALDSITRETQFMPADHAAVAAQLVGQLVVTMAGDRAAEVFSLLRRRHGIDGAA